MGNITLRELQEYIKATDHHPDRKDLYFLKLIEETGELAEVMRKNSRLAPGGSIKGTIEEELYDVLYYVAALANAYEIDLETCMRLKEEINRVKFNKKSFI